jgi:hypothetical protein
MAQLELPTFVAHVVPDGTAANGTVLAEDPPAGTPVACQCSVGLTVSGPSHQ